MSDLHVLAEVPNGFRPDGLGYVYDDAAKGLHWEARRLHESRHELYCELVVRRMFPAGHGYRLYRGSFNVSSATARRTIATYLRDQIPDEPGHDWIGMVTEFAHKVLDAHFQGAPPIRLFDLVEEDDECPMLLDPILWRDAPTLVYGAGGSGKSTVAAAIAISVETGAVVVPGWRPQVTAPVVVLDWESQAKVWKGQVRALCAGLGIDPPNIRYMPMAGALADQIERVASYVSEYAIGLVIVDSVEPASSTSDTDNYNAKAELFFDAVRHLNNQGCSALLIDHVTGADLKDGQPVLKSIGGVRKRDRARSAWEFRAESEPQDGRVEVVMRDSKHNLSAKRPSIGLALCFEDRDEWEVARRIVVRAADVTAPELQKVALSKTQQMLSILRDGAMTTDDLAEAMGVSKGSIRMYMTRLKGKVTRLPDNRIGLSAR